MNTSRDLESVLEIMLITYNRFECLDNTLKQLQKSPFAKCHITVLDNCSTDRTGKMTDKYRNKFEDFTVIRHPRNIGGDYNFLRAIELSTYRYTWILCDDDNYDFTYSDDVINAIVSCKYELVYVASRSPVQLGWNGHGETTVKELVKRGARYHRACAFWPSIIFKAEAFNNYCFQAASTIFPSMKFLNKSLEDDVLIYVAKEPIVLRADMCSSEVEPLKMYKEWVSNAALIQDRKLRAHVIEQWTDRGFFKSLAFWIAVDRTKKVAGYWKRLVDILFALSPWQKIKFLLLFPVMIIPVPISLLIRARELVYRLLGHKDVKNLPPIETVQR